MINLYDLLIVMDIHMDDVLITKMDEEVDISHLLDEKTNFKNKHEAHEFLSQFLVEIIKWEEEYGDKLEIQVR